MLYLAFCLCPNGILVTLPIIHLLLCEMIEIGVGKDLIWIQVELEQQFLGLRIIKINNTRPQHNLLFGFPLVMCFQKLPVFTLLGVCSVGFQALFFDFGRTYPVGSGSGRP